MLKDSQSLPFHVTPQRKKETPKQLTSLGVIVHQKILSQPQMMVTRFIVTGDRALALLL
jgi:hypothetical protein